MKMTKPLVKYHVWLGWWSTGFLGQRMTKKIAHCDLNRCFIHSFTWLMGFPAGYSGFPPKNKTLMLLPLVVIDFYFWTCESSEMIQKIIVDISVTISTGVSDLLKFYLTVSFCTFEALTHLSLTSVAVFILIVCRLIDEQWNPSVSAECSFEVDGDLCSPTCFSVCPFTHFRSFSLPCWS